MSDALVKSTLQAAFLGALSSILAQALTAYQSNSLFTLDTRDVLRFATFSFLSTPPNFAWQVYLEDSFPTRPATATTSSTTSTTKTKNSNEKTVTKSTNETDKGGGAFSVKNTLIKFLLDQSIGCWVNTALFIVLIGSLKGKEQGRIWGEEMKDDFWPMVLASYGFWPFVSVLNLVVVPAHQRVLVGNVAGLVWGVYINLITSK